MTNVFIRWFKVFALSLLIFQVVGCGSGKEGGTEPSSVEGGETVDSSTNPLPAANWNDFIWNENSWD